MMVASTDMQRFGRYAVVGLGSNLTLYVLFLVLVWAGMAPVLVSGLCYLLGVVISYLLNRFWTFSSQKGHAHDLPRFLAAYGFGLVVTLVSMSLLVAPLGPALAQAITIVICALTIYSTLSLLRFGR